jgi:hypothetical protein
MLAEKLCHATGAGGTCQTVGHDIQDVHFRALKALGPLGDAKIDTLSASCVLRTMREVELSSALAPLSRCRNANLLADVASIARRRSVAMLVPRLCANHATSSSFGVSESKHFCALS